MSLAFKSLQIDEKICPKPTFPEKVFSSLKSKVNLAFLKFWRVLNRNPKRITKFPDKFASERQLFINQRFLDQRSGHLDKILTLTDQNAGILTLI
jgi:hypothetical protein